MAREASALPHSFHPDRQFLAQSCRTVLCDLTQDCVRDGSFTSVRQLIVAMEQYLAARNEEPRRYVWKAKGEEILAKIQHARAALDMSS